MHPTLGSLRKSQAVFYASAFFQSDGAPPPAPARVTQTVGQPLAKHCYLFLCVKSGNEVGHAENFWNRRTKIYFCVKKNLLAWLVFAFCSCWLTCICNTKFRIKMELVDRVAMVIWMNQHYFACGLVPVAYYQFNYRWLAVYFFVSRIRRCLASGNKPDCISNALGSIVWWRKGICILPRNAIFSGGRHDCISNYHKHLV